MLGDAGEDLARSAFAEIDFKPEQFVRSRHTFRGDDRAYLDLRAPKFVK
jgi:hypothetical protein